MDLFGFGLAAEKLDMATNKKERESVLFSKGGTGEGKREYIYIHTVCCVG